MDRIVTMVGKEGRLDLESLEMRVRSSMHGIGGLMLENLLNADDGFKGKSIPCDNGHTYEFLEYRKKEVMTVIGAVEVNRAYYYDRHCRSGICPVEVQLYSPVGTRFIPHFFL